jgi:hypothetical protein
MEKKFFVADRAKKSFMPFAHAFPNSSLASSRNFGYCGGDDKFFAQAGCNYNP